MRKAIQITVLSLLLMFSFQALRAQDKMFLRRTSLLVAKQDRPEVTFRKFKKTDRSFKNPFRINKKVGPKLSMELLDDSGIHLFTISHTSFLDMRVGARFKAGLIINI